LLSVSPSPHIKNGVTTQRIMLHVLIALLPATVWGIIMFGGKAAATVAISVVACIFFEWATQKILKRRCTVSDLSAAVTGLLLGMNLPAEVSPLIPVVGAFIAIVVVKQLFGGIGKNFLNPALAARVFLFMSWSGEMASFSAPHGVDVAASVSGDAVAYATPLASLAGTGESGATILDMFIGRIGGSIGAAALITYINFVLQNRLSGELAALKLLIYAIILILVVIFSNAPALKDFRERFNVKALLRRITKPHAKPGTIMDDDAEWNRVESKIKMDEVLSVDFQNSNVYTPDKKKSKKEDE